jgi:predicted transposase YdaD
MPKPYDATLKTLLEASPTDWVELAGFSAPQVSVIDADVSTITGCADKVLLVRGNPSWILHYEFQSGPDETIPARTNLYNSVLHDRHQLLVRSVVVLLSRRANLVSIDGVYQCQFEDEAEPYRVFRYRVIRVWEMPADRLLSGGVGTIALAPLSSVVAADVPRVLREMKHRLERRRDPERDSRLWTAVYVLMGLRFERQVSEALLTEVIGMEESTTYQYIVQKGRIEEARKILLRQGRQRFGTPAGKRARTALAAIDDLDRLEALTDRVLSAESWTELLAPLQE